MNNYYLAKETIESNSDIVNFGSHEEGITDEWIRAAEKRLEVKFPPSYTWWMKNYGGGDILGDEIFSIYGINFDEVVGGDVVYINELDRKNGITNNKQVSIQKNNQGQSYYINLDEIDETGESPVYNRITKTKYADNFLDFIIKQIKEA
ncbi:SMI1/KNR4 family protein [Mucilaginibacter sp. Bleaf8]|uniref:SMI1/KNR4 family protein n=1 Tax=Mucilaginibacter sp. Bleaf8 TaxID=2834430 RepID=UPI001BCCB658|nr:SMI1/KNR4 family protein [Mucilaginibacter sp. Bleaf8]MBS7564650.1 SMI1/KNR4 family protein [Mucilaginibacter sp. Bleaf8]